MRTAPLTVQLALLGAAKRLELAGIAGAQRDVRYLMAHVMGLERDRLSILMSEVIDPEPFDRFASMVEKRMQGVPVSRIIGERLFYGRRFKVADAVLDPRPETEVLVEAALDAPFTRLLDLGTGSGCIAVTLLAEREQVTGMAGDLSDAALAVAGENAARHGVSDRLTLVQSDWYGATPGNFDLVVSNPPYIAEAEMQGLSVEVRDHDPRMALTDGGDGLSAYRAITAGINAVLSPGGRLLVEIGPTQGGAVSALFRGAGLEDVRVLPDLDGRDRVVSGYRPT
ncbi:release factor glutamine methyltransferase [Primorskyibacter flagellatus]|uniref:Release factor glutamine methyltransferase n=1 Tax=Primorskyibacter flagellatus TaxID=1387277 RepID=A0A917ECI6_9RHOB|nr:peptide chain release factor N(5)-glutamine methyltransferase [Primorskyibacter flagellatus]GGE23932.1 release factor glutamine methyltransferase [Primorskyibacter flagellatus]